MTRRRPVLIEISQAFFRWAFRLLLMLAYRIRVHGLERYPQKDGFLVCANHQSFLDPMVIGVLCPRPINYLARKGLFDVKAIRWF